MPSAHSTPSFSDDDFLRLCKGDQLAFKKAYDLYFGLVQYVALRCSLPKQDCDDVTQECFLKLFRFAGTIESASKVKSWLAVTARNMALDILRRNRQLKTISNDYSFQNVVLENSLPLERELELIIVGEFIEEVSLESGGECFKQFYIEGLSAREIAEKNNEAVSTVTTRLTRLRRKFKERLELKIKDLEQRITN